MIDADLLAQIRRATALKEQLEAARLATNFSQFKDHVRQLKQLSDASAYAKQLAAAVSANTSSTAAIASVVPHLKEAFALDRLKILSEAVASRTALGPDWLQQYSRSLQQFREITETARSISELESLRVESLGKNGWLNAISRSLGSLPDDDKKAAGPLVNKLKQDAEDVIRARKAQLEAEALEAELKATAVDLTLPAPPRRRGAVHPTMQVMDELVQVFAEMGFAVAEGPDVEDDWHNFTALNFPPKHPAREMHDTFFLRPDETGERKVLRTHTSPVQVRTMQTQAPPIRIVAPGRVYRNDSDATHTPVFHQIEGLVIDKGIHMGHLKWTLETFVARFFETSAVETRFRPHHFPFTEPSAEMDVRCDRSGAEVKIGQGDSWMEILGCGMVHPNVLRNCGIDPDEWQGFAFGLGVDRMAMLKYGIPDLRDMFAADVRWLRHYGFSAFATPNAASGLS